MSNLTWIILLIPAFPLLGFLVNTFFIRDERTAGRVASGAVILAFVMALLSIAVLQAQPEPAEGGRRIDYILWEWISVGSFRVPFGFLFDHLTAVMALLVTGVGAIIHVYSIGYMHGDVRQVRFFAYLNLFIFSMLMLIMGDNMLLLFLGWEGVGLCSFLLIGHYFDRRSVQPGINPSGAAVKAFVVNRVGDVGMLLAMAAIFSRLGSLSFYNQDPMLDGRIVPGFLAHVNDIAFAQLDLGAFGTIGIATAICLLILLGVTGKSAQVPLFVWLPDAMAGPTPVSALIHAATMVTSGVYLIARVQPLFQASPTAAGWVVTIGVLTALLAALAAVAQFDIKRVLAYSTISQLGYMIVAVGMGAVSAGMFHLLTHGIFKALLFLAAGSVIHGAHDHQDMRRMGGLRTKMPTTYWTYLVGALALAGIFPFAGFWSKDEIISYAWFNGGRPVGAILLIFASMITAFYMGRQIALIFFGQQRDTTYTPHESGQIITVPLIILAVGAVIGGLINFPGLHWLSDFLHPVFATPGAPPVDETYTLGQGILAVVTTLLAAASGYAGWYLYTHGAVARRVRIGQPDPLYRYNGDIWTGAEIGWGFDWFYDHAIVRPYRTASRFLSDVYDRQGIDGTLVDGTGRLMGRAAESLRGAQTGFIRNYVLIFLVGVVLMVGYFALS
ncbi:MAG TPA: NADH-quinone oxidoreductase subunit L [Roseiflexaceae bacterium]|jgi:NADH-quinone oxidoreductase subunit L|nr:NADH-quinone oxidoreductase subunit L [Roseiflexaceae bacterium]